MYNIIHKTNQKNNPVQKKTEKINIIQQHNRTGSFDRIISQSHLRNITQSNLCISYSRWVCFIYIQNINTVHFFIAQFVSINAPFSRPVVKKARISKR